MGRLVLLTLAVITLMGASVAGAALGWRVVRSGSASGQFAIKSISADVQRPKPNGIAVRLVGKVSNGTGVVSCTRGTAVAAWSRSYRGAGLFVLPMTRGAEMCSVVAAVGGSGKVVVQILRR